MTELTAVAVTFGTVLVVELPDKTFLATLVLATRYRPWPVWLGVGAAFGVQVAIAVAAGQLATLLPAPVVSGVAAAIFALGAVLLLREARQARSRALGNGLEDEESPADPTRLRATTTAWGMAGTSFLVLFTAEWGDLSQLLTASLAARYEAPFAVFAGAWVALLAVSGLAVLLGRVLLARIRLALLYALGAGVCLVLTALTLVTLVGQLG